jgi:HK97 family phage prohead protease
MGAQLVMQRSFTVELEETDGRMVEGCVVPYGEAARVQDVDPDTGEMSSPYFEVFEPGAFRKQLRAAGRIELRYEHRDDLAHSIGVCRSLHDESSGLFGAFRVHDGAFGDQALELVRAKILPGFSVEFVDRFRHWQRTAEGTVVRRSCELLSVGLTRTPAYATAQVVGVRSRAEYERELELPPVDDAQLERLRALGVEL